MNFQAMLLAAIESSEIPLRFEPGERDVRRARKVTLIRAPSFDLLTFVGGVRRIVGESRATWNVISSPVGLVPTTGLLWITTESPTGQELASRWQGLHP